MRIFSKSLLGVIFFLIIFSSFLFSDEKNEIYTFNNNSDNVLVFTAVKKNDGSDTESIKQLRNVVSVLKNETTNIDIIIAFTKNHDVDLPEEIALSLDYGAYPILNIINQYENSAVFIFDDADSITKIIAGGSGKTSPDWMLTDLYTQLTTEEKYYCFNPLSIYTYRLNLMDTKTLLDFYLENNIPSILLKANSNIERICFNLIDKYSTGLPKIWDNNYLVVKLHKLYIISETGIIVLVLILMTISFFILFIFTFRKHMKIPKEDIFKMIGFIFLFFIVNVVIFFSARYITQLLFYFNFGTLKSLKRFSMSATVSFLILSITFLLTAYSILFYSLKKIEINSILKSHIISILSLLNIFIFSGFHFLFFLIFFASYIFSLLFSRSKKLWTQVITLVLMILPFTVFFVIINKDLSKVVDFLFSKQQLLLAFLFLPFVFALFRIINLNNLKTKKILFIFLPIGLLFCGNIIFIFMLQPYSKTNPLPVYIHQNIRGMNTSDVKVLNSVVADVKLDSLKLENAQPQILNVDEYLTLNVTLDNYLERSLGTIKINSDLKLVLLEIVIENKDGFAVYEADDFTSMRSGNIAVFTSSIYPEIPFELNFSSEKNATLSIKVKAWTYDNPFNTKIKKNHDEYFDEYFVLGLEQEILTTAKDLE